MRYLWHTLSAILMFLFAACSVQENADIADVGRIDITVKVVETAGFAPNCPFALLLTSADGQYSSLWNNYEDFPSYEVFHAGEYKAEIISGAKDAQGYECPCYIGEAVFKVEAAATAHVEIECRLCQAIVVPNYSAQFQENFPDARIVLHAHGAEYLELERESARPVLLTPGETAVMLGIMYQQEEVLISLGATQNTKAAVECVLKVDSPDPELIQVSFGDATAQRQITPELLQAPAPQITAFGFQPGEILSLIEGYPAPKNVKMQVSSSTPLTQLNLTVIGMDGLIPGFPTQCNLIAEGSQLKQYGLDVAIQGTSATIEFTDLLENIRVEASRELKFLLQACDDMGRLSTVCTMEVEIKNVDFAIIEYNPAIVGIDLADVTLTLNTDKVETSDFEIFRIIEETQAKEKLEVRAAHIDDVKKLITFNVEVPEGISSVPIAISYMGVERAQGMIPRSVPSFEIVVDPFSKSAAILIKAQPAEVQEAITKYATVWCQGKKLSVNRRMPEQGLVSVLGLEPNKNFDLTVTVIEGQATASAKIHTEKGSQIPEGDFEDFEQIIFYSDMPAGGAYSASPFPIYNMQNFANFDVKWVTKHWASTNAKTFCTKAKNLNTWYLQPSAWLDLQAYASGAKSVCLSSVGWNLDGPEIAPYMQTGNEYLPYNPNVPATKHHAAGKMFLGSYIFDPITSVEVYDEGIAFDCRPTSINGYYKYEPDENDANDKGYLRIELINDDSGEDIIISTAEKEFTGAPDFIAFNLPLEYKAIGIKATKLKIFFSSSAQWGDIEHEDQFVPISPWVKDSKFVGSRLWIDNLSFSY